MSATLATDLFDLRQAVATASRSPEAAALAAMRAQAFAKRAMSYKDKYKSQPGVRKAIIFAGTTSLTVADVLQQIIARWGSLEPNTVRKIVVSLGVALSTCSLSHMPEDAMAAVTDRTDSAQNTLEQAE